MKDLDSKYAIVHPAKLVYLCQQYIIMFVAKAQSAYFGFLPRRRPNYRRPNYRRLKITYIMKMVSFMCP